MLNLRRSSLLNRFINLFSMTTVPFRLFSKFFPHMDESLLGKNKNSAKYLQPSFLCPIEIDYISKKERDSCLSAVFFWKIARSWNDEVIEDLNFQVHVERDRIKTNSIRNTLTLIIRKTEQFSRLGWTFWNKAVNFMINYITKI